MRPPHDVLTACLEDVYASDTGDTAADDLSPLASIPSLPMDDINAALRHMAAGESEEKHGVLLEMSKGIKRATKGVLILRSGDIPPEWGEFIFIMTLVSGGPP